MAEEKKEEQVVEEEVKITAEDIEATEETKEEIKEDTSITATDNEGNTVSEAKNISQDEPKNEEAKEPAKTEPSKEDVMKVALADYNKQLEEMRTLYDGLKKGYEDEINKVKADYEEKLKVAEERSQKLENDISELRESPFYKSSTTTSDKPMTGLKEYTEDDIAKLRNKI